MSIEKHETQARISESNATLLVQISTESIQQY